jgi:hypothetical protein
MLIKRKTTIKAVIKSEIDDHGVLFDTTILNIKKFEC